MDSKSIQNSLMTQKAASPSIPTPTQLIRPILFLDIDGVLNTTKHNTQIHFSKPHLARLKLILKQTNAIIVLTTFWRHFHEYISYVFHRHGIDVTKHVLDLPMGATPGKQCTKKFLHFHRLKRKQNDGTTLVEEDDNSRVNFMLGRSAQDEGEYSSRAEEIEAWLRVYGEKYLGAAGEHALEKVQSDKETDHLKQHLFGGTGRGTDNFRNGEYKIDFPHDCSSKNVPLNSTKITSPGYEFHPQHWKYVILDDRPSAAKPDTPLMDRFVLTTTDLGLTDDDTNRAIELLLCGPKASQSLVSDRN